MIQASYKLVTRIDGMGQGIIDFNANDLGYVLRKPNISPVVIDGDYAPLDQTTDNTNITTF